MDTQRIMARVSGTLLLAFGIALAVLASWAIERQLTLLGTIRADAAAFIIGASVLCLFCFTVGYRLAFDRPNRYNSILSPTSWLLLATCLGAISIVLFLYLFYVGIYINALAALAFGIAFVYGCAKARRTAIGKRKIHGAP